MNKSIYYDVDISDFGSREEYQEGENIDWQKEMTFDTREEADECVKHYINIGKVASVRIVKVTDPENTPEIKDVYTWFKYSLK